MFKSYLNSFRWQRDLWKPFIIDIISLSIITSLWFVLGKILSKLAYALSQGQTVEELKLALLSSPKIAQAFLTNTKYFTVALIAGTLIIVIITLLIFSLSRAMIWSMKFDIKQYWKWNGLNLVLSVIFVIYAVLYVLINLLLNLVITSPLIKGMINGIFLILFLIFLFTAYHSFARTYQISEALSYTFKIIKQKFWSYFAAFIFIFLTGIVLSLAISLLKKQFYWQILGWPKWLTLSLELVIVLIYIAWVRFYVSRI